MIKQFPKAETKSTIGTLWIVYFGNRKNFEKSLEKDSNMIKKLFLIMLDHDRKCNERQC